MTYTAAEARQQLLDTVADATDELGIALAALGAASGRRALTKLGLFLGLGTIAAMADIGARKSVPAANDNGTAVVALLALARQPQIRQQYAAAFAVAREQLSWELALQPLINFCVNPRFAPDRFANIRARTPSKTLPATHLQETVSARLLHLEAIIQQKNEHIRHLERLIKQLESGRVMRFLNFVNRLRQLLFKH